MAHTLDWHTASLPQNFVLSGEHSLQTQSLLGSSRNVSPHWWEEALRDDPNNGCVEDYENRAGTVVTVLVLNCFVPCLNAG